MKIAVLAVTVSLFAATAAYGGEFDYPKDGFAITLPGQPTYSASVVNSGPSPVEHHDYVYDMGNGARFVVSATAIPGLEKADEASTTRSAAEQAAKKGNAADVSYSDIMLGSHRGTAATFTLNGKLVKNHYFLAGGRFYLLSAAASPSAFPAVFDQAFASFRLTQ
jgi:hypothetical protein